MSLIAYSSACSSTRTQTARLSWSNSVATPVIILMNVRCEHSSSVLGHDEVKQKFRSKAPNLSRVQLHEACLMEAKDVEAVLEALIEVASPESILGGQI